MYFYYLSDNKLKNRMRIVLEQRIPRIGSFIYERMNFCFKFQSVDCKSYKDDMYVY